MPFSRGRPKNKTSKDSSMQNAGTAPPSQENSFSPEYFSGKHQRNPHQFHQPEAAFKPAG